MSFHKEDLSRLELALDPSKRTRDKFRRISEALEQLLPHEEFQRYLENNTSSVWNWYHLFESICKSLETSVCERLRSKQMVGDYPIKILKHIIRVYHDSGHIPTSRSSIKLGGIVLNHCLSILSCIDGRANTLWEEYISIFTSSRFSFPDCCSEASLQKTKEFVMKVAKSLPNKEIKSSTLSFCAELIQNFPGTLPAQVLHSILSGCIVLCKDLQQNKDSMYKLFPGVLHCVNALLRRYSDNIKHDFWSVQEAILSLLIPVFSRSFTNNRHTFKMMLLEYIKLMIRLNGFSKEEVQFSEQLMSQQPSMDSGSYPASAYSDLNVDTPTHSSITNERKEASSKRDLNLLESWKEQVLKTVYAEITNFSKNSLGTFTWSSDLGIHLTVHQQSYAETLAALVIDSDCLAQPKDSGEEQERKGSKTEAMFRSYEIEIKEHPEIWIPVLSIYLEQHFTILSETKQTQCIKLCEKLLLNGGLEDKSDIVRIWMFKIFITLAKLWNYEAKWTRGFHSLWKNVFMMSLEILYCGKVDVEDYSWRLINEIIKKSLIDTELIEMRSSLLTGRAKKQHLSTSSKLFFHSTSQLEVCGSLLNHIHINEADQSFIMNRMLNCRTLVNSRLSVAAYLALLDKLLGHVTTHDKLSDLQSKTAHLEYWNPALKASTVQVHELLFFCKSYSMDIHYKQCFKKSFNLAYDCSKTGDLEVTIRSILDEFPDTKAQFTLQLASVLIKLYSSSNTALKDLIKENCKSKILSFASQLQNNVHDLIHNKHQETEIISSMKSLVACVPSHTWVKDSILSVISAIKFSVLKSFNQVMTSKHQMDDLGSPKKSETLNRTTAARNFIILCFKVMESTVEQFSEAVNAVVEQIIERAKEQPFCSWNVEILHHAIILNNKIKAHAHDFSFLRDYLDEGIEEVQSIDTFFLESLIDSILSCGACSGILSSTEFCSWIEKWNSSSDNIQYLDELLDYLVVQLKSSDLSQKLSKQLSQKLILFSMKLKSLSAKQSSCSTGSLLSLVKLSFQLLSSYNYMILFSALLRSSVKQCNNGVNLVSSIEALFYELVEDVGSDLEFQSLQNAVLFLPVFALLDLLSEVKSLLLISTISVVLQNSSSLFIKLVQLQSSFFGYPTSQQYFKVHKLDFIFAFFATHYDLQSYISLHELFAMERKEFLKCSRKSLFTYFFCNNQEKGLHSLAMELECISVKELLDMKSELLLLVFNTSEEPSQTVKFAKELQIMFRRFSPLHGVPCISGDDTNLSTDYSEDIISKFYEIGISKALSLTPTDVLSQLQDFHILLIKAKCIQHKLKYLEALSCFCRILDKGLYQTLLLGMLFNCLGKQLTLPLLSKKVAEIMIPVVSEMDHRRDILDNGSCSFLTEGMLLFTANLISCIDLLQQDDSFTHKEHMGPFFYMLRNAAWLDNKSEDLKFEVLNRLVLSLRKLMDSETLCICPFPHTTKEQDLSELVLDCKSVSSLLQTFEKVAKDMLPCARQRSALVLSKRTQFQCEIKKILDQCNEPGLLS